MNEIYKINQTDLNNETATPGLISAAQLATLGGGDGLTGKLEWGTPIPYDLRFPITQPVINGNTWESTTAVGVGGLKGTAYSTLIPQGVYTDFIIDMVGSADARALLYFNESTPNVEAFESTSIAGFYISITGAGVVTLNKNGEKESLATVVGTFPFPISFGLRTATPVSEPTLLVNGTGYTVGASQHTYLSLTSLFEGVVENDSVVVEVNPSTKTHEAAGFSGFIGTLSTLPTKFSPLQHNLPESESSLVDNIDSSSITKVSPKKLNSWLVTKQLTPDDIANATENAGTVSGEQLAALGGGTEILKDWTVIYGPDIPDTELTNGLSLSDVGGLTVEFEAVAAQGVANIRAGYIIPHNTALIEPDDWDVRSNAVTTGVSNASIINTSGRKDHLFSYYAAINALRVKGSVEILSTVGDLNGAPYYCAATEVKSTNIQSYLNVNTHVTQLTCVTAVMDQSPLNKLIFGDTDGRITEFRYRIIRKN